MGYATVALRAATKERLDELRRQGKFASMDDVVAAALAELEAALTSAEVGRLARRAAGRRTLLADAERDSEGVEATVNAIRKGARKRFG